MYLLYFGERFLLEKGIKMKKIIVLVIISAVLLALAACDGSGTVELPEATPLTDQQSAILTQSGISEYGWQVAAEFLSGLPA